MITIDIREHQFLINDAQVASIEIAPLTFATYSRISTDAYRIAKTTKEANVNMFRERLVSQCTLKFGDGKAAKFTPETISKAPPRLGLMLKNKLDIGSEGAGRPELLSDPKADGIGHAIHIKLGSPIKAQGGKEIAEIEFMAKTLGEIEEMVVADNRLDQMLALMAIAKPVGGMTLLALPSWAIDQITFADGWFMVQEVLSRFLGETPEASAN